MTRVKLGNIKGPKGDTGPKGPQGNQGPKGDPGQPFKIAKIFTSISNMNSNISTVNEGDMVLINTNNVNDEDNAKLFVKSGSSFSFICDLSLIHI